VSRAPRNAPRSRTGLWLAALIAAGLGGAVSAQPTGPSPQGQQPPPPDTAAAGAPPPAAAEEAPPVNVPTPQPMAVPPIDEKEVAPAPPPETAPTPVQPKVPEAPLRRGRFDVAVLQALDKVTAETLRFEAPVGRPIRYKTLIFTVRACEQSAPDEPIEDSIAYVEVLSQPRPEPGRPALPPRQAFKGWMFASSPGLNPFEHPVYAAWLISCRAAAPPPAPGPIVAPAR
jgi:hypothetical protein